MPQGSHNPSLLRQVIEAALFREDKHYPPMAAHAAAAAERNGDLEAGKRFTLPVNDPDHLIPPNDKLLIFRALTGIDSVPALTSGGHLLRTAPNIGIHTRVVNNETKSARAYRIFSWMINICLGIQIVVAAAVTALGAASGPHSAVTAFGAINTVMAGILTYLRGSGLPDRLKAYQNVKSEMETTKSSGDGNSQQPDDPRIRRSLLPSSNELSIQRAAMRSSKYAEVPCPHHSHDDERGSPITAPKKTAEKP
jgi:hypothetical protein